MKELTKRQREYATAMFVKIFESRKREAADVNGNSDSINQTHLGEVSGVHQSTISKILSPPAYGDGEVFNFAG